MLWTLFEASLQAQTRAQGLDVLDATILAREALRQGLENFRMTKKVKPYGHILRQAHEIRIFTRDGRRTNTIGVVLLLKH